MTDTPESSSVSVSAVRSITSRCTGSGLSERCVKSMKDVDMDREMARSAVRSITSFRADSGLSEGCIKSIKDVDMDREMSRYSGVVGFEGETTAGTVSGRGVYFVEGEFSTASLKDGSERFGLGDLL